MLLVLCPACVHLWQEKVLDLLPKTAVELTNEFARLVLPLQLTVRCVHLHYIYISEA